MLFFVCKLFACIIIRGSRAGKIDKKEKKFIRKNKNLFVFYKNSILCYNAYMRIYLDNCCYNRPYDDQSYLRISLEAQAKLFIQQLIRAKKLDLVTSYVLDYENSRNPSISRRDTISDFFENAVLHIDSDKNKEILPIAKKIQSTGIKVADSCHVACAEYAKCDYFLTTDDRLLKYKSSKTIIMNPVQFIQVLSKEGLE